MTLEGYETDSFTHDGVTRTLYRAGAGPGVIVMAEMPGITPKVAAFGRRLCDEGFSVAMPSLFGRPGTPPSPGAFLRSLVPACVASEFAAFATGRTAPVTDWLRALARHVHDMCGGPGVGAVGMCFTGGFALGMMVEETTVAPVLSQPSLPLGLTRRHKADLHLSPQDRDRVAARAAAGTCVLGLRFTEDPLCPPERFAALRELLGDRFIGVEIDSSPGNPWGFHRRAHSVLTEELRTEDPEHPTARALDEVIAFLRDRLVGS